jgi:hypothetical protein
VSTNRWRSLPFTFLPRRRLGQTFEPVAYQLRLAQLLGHRRFPLVCRPELGFFSFHCTSRSAAEHPTPPRTTLRTLPSPLLVRPHLPAGRHQHRLTRRVLSLEPVPKGSILGSLSHWLASPFNAASSPESAERSQAASLVTSFGSCGPIYELRLSASSATDMPKFLGRYSPCTVRLELG